MSRYMLDTDICIQLMRRRATALVERMRGHDVDDIGLSTITLAELQYGAAKSSRIAYHAQLIAELCAPLAIFPFDSFAAETYGTVRADLEKRGTPIGALDTLIAAHALSRSLTVITGNVREFGRVRNLRVENWL